MTVTIKSVRAIRLLRRRRADICWNRAVRPIERSAPVKCWPPRIWPRCARRSNRCSPTSIAKCRVTTQTRRCRDSTGLHRPIGLSCRRTSRQSSGPRFRFTDQSLSGTFDHHASRWRCLGLLALTVATGTSLFFADEITRIRATGRVPSQFEARRSAGFAQALARGALDLNGIAPGFAVDRIAQCLKRHRVTNYLIRLDGHIRSRGHALDGRPWRVGIDRPTEIPSGVQLAIELGDGSLSTSGDYRHYFLHDGRRYSHIIDPRTGWPIAHSATSVSIVADDCLTADAWAKALMVLGPVDGVRLANQRGIAAYYIVRTSGDSGEADFQTVPTEHFATRFLDTSKVVEPDARPAHVPTSALYAPSPDEPHTIVAPFIAALIALALLIFAIVVRRRWSRS